MPCLALIGEGDGQSHKVTNFGEISSISPHRELIIMKYGMGERSTSSLSCAIVHPDGDGTPNYSKIGHI